MNPSSQELIVQIVRLVDERFPGWVASEFVDANAIRHTITDKVPIFTEVLDESSQYPQAGSVSCEVLANGKMTRDVN